MIPVPVSVTQEEGVCVLGTRIVVRHDRLWALADVLAEEVRRLTNRSLHIESGVPGSGDVVLEMDHAHGAHEAYVLDIGDTIVVRGGSSVAVAWGTVTLLHALESADGKVTLPRMRVEDEPAAAYRGLMVDLARNWHSIDALRNYVVLCRWYKIGHLHLHFSDNECFTFPSGAFRKLNDPGLHYTAKQLRELESFACDRGVVIVPELEVPGHSGAVLERMPDLDCDPPGGKAVCPGREAVYRTMDVLIGEMADIFRSSPYIHIGADEVEMEQWKNCGICRAAMARHGLADVHELYRYFIVRMNEIVKRHRKKTIVWEGFRKEGKTLIPRDITVMVYENLYNLAPDLVAQGYSIINTSWQPLYVVNSRNWSPEYIYGWNMHRWENHWEKSHAYGKPIVIEPTDLLLGAQMCAWEQTEAVELPSLRHRLPAMSERVWNPDAGRDYTDFAARLEGLDAKLSKLLL